MSETKPQCKKCEAVILPSTAEQNDGYCMKCKDSALNTIEAVGDTIEFGMRLFLGVCFGGFAAVLGYTLGSLVWSGIGILLALCLAPVGLIYGFFITEINFVIRLVIKAVRLWIGL